MRNAFLRALLEEARRDDRIALVVGDLGFSVVEPFREELPSRFLNAGVAEQAMTGIAAGWSLAAGMAVFTYSIANFPTLRCLEQVRNDVCYHAADVKIVSVGGGVAYGTAGYTHHALEDLAILRALPNMTVIVPGDPAEARAACRLAARTPGPFYIRLGKNGEPAVHPGEVEIRPGESFRLREGHDATLITGGPLTAEALRAADALAGDGIATRVLSMPVLRPIDRDAILRAAEETRAIVTSEEHVPWGGLGSAVAEVLAESPRRARFRSLAIAVPPKRLGSQSHLWRELGLDASAMAGAVRALLA